jgi:hypothetical protein
MINEGMVRSDYEYTGFPELLCELPPSPLSAVLVTVAGLAALILRRQANRSQRGHQ